MFQHHLQMRVHFSKQEYLLHMFIISINCIWCIFTRLCATLMITIICGTINKHVYICTGDRTTFSRGRMVQGDKNHKKKLKRPFHFWCRRKCSKQQLFQKGTKMGPMIIMIRKTTTIKMMTITVIMLITTMITLIMSIKIKL